MRRIFKNQWKDHLTCNSEPEKKLRTYIKFKSQFGPERYLYLLKDYGDQNKYYQW